MVINTTTTIRVVAVSSAAGLVLASAGFSALYAHKIGIQHSILLAGLSILMAVALEGVKPLAIAAGLSALRAGCSKSVPTLLLTLGGISVAYSLTAELSLISMSRGDVIASREASIKAASDVELEAQRARDRYDRARAELDTLAVTRPASQLRAEIDGLLLTPGADDCAVINGKVTREVCPKVLELRAEKARAERRAELEAVLATPLPHSSVTSEQSVSTADPGSVALTTYLSVLGFSVSPQTVGQWLILVPVLALEIGSALAMVLVQAVSPSAPKGPGDQPQKPAKRREPRTSEPASAKDSVAKAIVNELQAAGGSLSRSERGLAKLIGTSKPTARRAIHGLAAAGIIALEATKAGTVLKLVA